MLKVNLNYTYFLNCCVDFNYLEGGRPPPPHDRSDMQKHPSSLAVLAEISRKLAEICSIH